MILSGKAVECDPLPVGIVRKTMLGKPVALVREYSFCTVDEKTAVEHLGAEPGCGEAIDGFIRCDRRVCGIELAEQIIERGHTLYITLATSPMTALLLSECIVRNAGGDHVTFDVPMTRVHNTGGGTSDVRIEALERMRVADRGGYTEKEMEIYSDYERFLTYGYTEVQALARLKEKHGIETPLLESSIKKVRECLK